MFKQRTILPSVTIAGAVADQLSGVEVGLYGMKHLAIEANFAYGAGGTDVKVWIQTSLDGGNNWIDIANFRFLITAKRAVASLNAETSVTTIYVPLDAALANDSVKDGILGDQLRVKWTSTGTYSGVTALEVNIVPKG